MRDETDYYSMSYRQGYWDGVQASESGEVGIEDGVYITKHKAKSSKARHRQQDEVPQALTPELPQTIYPEAATYPRQQFEAPAPVVVSPPVATEEQRASTRRHIINITLYSASLLLVSGILLLAQTAGLGSVLKFILVWILIAACYLVGLILHARVPLLKPAAVSFVGTALAAVPIAGIVMYNLVTKEAALCWFFTSLIGMLMYAYATVQLKSQVLAYVTLLSFFIFSCTLPAVAHAQIVWYYVVMIVFGSLLTVLSHFKFSWLPQVFAQPVGVVSPIAVPLVLVVSPLSFMVMSTGEYAAVFGAATAYYLAQALTTQQGAWHQACWTLARTLAMVTVVTVASAVSGHSFVVMSITTMAVAFVNIMVSASSMKPRRAEMNHHEWMIWISFLATFAACLMVADVLNQGHAFIHMVHLSVIAVLSISLAIYLRRFEMAWPAVVALTALPVVGGIFAIQPSVGHGVIASLYALLIFLAMALRIGVLPRRSSAGGLSLIYVAVSVWLTAMAVALVGLGAFWWVAWWLLVAGICYIATWIERATVMLVFGNGAALMATTLVTRELGASVGVTAVILAWLHMAVSICSSELLRRAPIRGPELFSAGAISAAVYGGIVGLSVLNTANGDGMRLLGWIPAVAIFYWYAWRVRSIGVLALGHIAASVVPLLLALACGATWPLALGITAWVTFTVFVAASYISLLPQRVRTVSWRVGAIVAGIFGAVGFVMSSSDAERVLAWSAVATCLYYVAWVARSTGLLYSANLAAVVLAVLLCSWSGLDGTTTAVIVAWLGAVGFYGAGRIYRLVSGSIRVWQTMFVSGLLTALITAIPVAFFSGASAIWASLALIVVGATLCFDDYEWRRLRFVDIGAVIAMVGLQRAIALTAPGIDSLFYTHLWAGLLLVLAGVYRQMGRRSDAEARLVFALLAISFPLLFSALSGGAGKQVLFLVEHAILVVIGLAAIYRLAAIWGAVGVSFAVLYMLRGFTSVLTIIIGLVMIGAVIWVIIRANKKQPPQPPTTPAQ